MYYQEKLSDVSMIPCINERPSERQKNLWHSWNYNAQHDIVTISSLQQKKLFIFFLEDSTYSIKKIICKPWATSLLNPYIWVLLLIS